MTRTKIPKEDILAKMQDLGYTILDEFKNTKCSVNFKCKKGHIWKTHVANVYREVSGCPECSRPSSEATCIFIIETLLGKRFKKTRQVLPSGYELDGYNDELKLAIEYNGSQHYVECRYFHRTENAFASQLERDCVKQAECKDLGIDLITVHYKLNTFNKIREYIESEVVRLGYQIKTGIDWHELKANFRKNYDPILDAFKGIKELVEERNGVVISTNYVDRLDPMIFQCEVLEHPPFEKTPADIRRGVWCNLCAHNAPQSTESINKEFEPHGFFLAKEYVPGSHSIQTFSCFEGHIFERQLDNMRRTVKDSGGCTRCNNLVWEVPIYQYSKDGTYVATFSTLKDIPLLSKAKTVDITNVRDTVRKCILGESKIAQGYIWSFLQPTDNKLLRFRDTRAKYSADELKFIDHYRLAISKPVKSNAGKTSSTGTTKAKNLPVIKFDLLTFEILERYESVRAAINAGNKSSTIYNSCTKFAKYKDSVDLKKIKNKQIFIYEDDNQLIPWVNNAVKRE